VIYAGDAELAVPLPNVDEYAFRATGSLEIPAFDAVIPAPDEPRELRIDGAPPREGHAVNVSIAREAGVELSWLAGDPGDRIEMQVRAHGDVIACVGYDDGMFRVDADALAILAPDEAANVLVRRVRVTPVDVPGLDDAYARVAVTRTVRARLR